MHQSDDGALLVLDLLIDTGNANPPLDELFSRITNEVSGDKGEPMRTPIDPADLLPADSTSVQYRGSLTMPPCAEGVE